MHGNLSTVILKLITLHGKLVLYNVKNLLYYVCKEVIVIMEMTEKLDILMKEKGLNKKSLSNESGIPYTTIINFYKLGTNNVKLSTLRGLAVYFNCSLDYLADDYISDRTIKHNKLISDKEEKIILSYRKNINIQSSIDKLLDINSDNAEPKKAYTGEM